MKKAQMILKEFVLLVLVAVVFFVLFSFIVDLGATIFDVRSPTEKSFDLFTQEVQRLVSSDEPFVQNRNFPLTIQDDYLIIAFDKTYEPSNLIAYKSDIHPHPYINELFYKALPLIDPEPNNRVKSDHVTYYIGKPQSCGMYACLCLLKHDNLKKCVPIVDTKEVVLSSHKFVDVPSGLAYFSTPKFDIFSLNKGNKGDGTAWDKPVQNVGFGRGSRNIVFKDVLKSQGFSDTWINPYGYLALAGKIYYPMFSDGDQSFGTKQLYIEKQSIDGYDIIFVVPDVGGTISITGDIADIRLKQYEEESKVSDLTSDIVKLQERIKMEESGMTTELKRAELGELYNHDTIAVDIKLDLNTLFWKENWESFLKGIGLDASVIDNTKKQLIELMLPDSIDSILLKDQFNKIISDSELEKKKEDFFNKNYPSLIQSYSNDGVINSLEDLNEKGVKALYDHRFPEGIDFVEENYKRIFQECYSLGKEYENLKLPDICQELTFCKFDDTCQIEEPSCICETYFGADFCTGEKFCYYEKGCIDEQPKYPACYDIPYCEMPFKSCRIAVSPTETDPCKCDTYDGIELCEVAGYCYAEYGCRSDMIHEEDESFPKCGAHTETDSYSKIVLHK